MTSELVMRFRQARGLDGSFRGGPRNIEDAIWKDYFYKLDMTRTISIKLHGNGPETRSLKIDRGPGETTLSLKDSKQTTSSSGVSFHWTDEEGNEHDISPKISTAGIQFPDTGEHLPDFFFFASNQTYSSTENADRFSELSRAKQQKPFIELFTKEFEWIEDLSIEVIAGAPAIYASIRGLPDKIPITSISGGINRFITILLAIASRKSSVVCVDEMENGLFYSHQLSFWRSIISFTRDYNAQLFLTTHSKEWLEALSQAAGDDVRDIVLMRLERDENGRPELLKFEGADFKAGIEYNAEIRGGP